MKSRILFVLHDRHTGSRSVHGTVHTFVSALSLMVVDAKIGWETVTTRARS